jgi:hypothetical protein
MKTVKITTSNASRRNSTVQFGKEKVFFGPTLEAEVSEDAAKEIIKNNPDVGYVGEEEKITPTAKKVEGPKLSFAPGELPLDPEEKAMIAAEEAEAAKAVETEQKEEEPEEEKIEEPGEEKTEEAGAKGEEAETPASLRNTLKHMKKGDIQDIAKESGYPAEEWEPLTKEDLVEYIIKKAF